MTVLFILIIRMPFLVLSFDNVYPLFTALYPGVVDNTRLLSAPRRGGG